MVKPVVETIECPRCGAWGTRYSKCQNVNKVHHSVYCKWCGFEDWWDTRKEDDDKTNRF